MSGPRSWTRLVLSSWGLWGERRREDQAVPYLSIVARPELRATVKPRDRAAGSLS
jgi:hypothetical protein